MSKLTQAELRRVLCYNPLSGNFMWRKRPNISAPIQIGDIAGSIKKLYRIIGINRHRYRAHHLAFLYIRGHWPYNEVDHIDRNGLNNCWLNLRECTRSQNMANQGPQRHNKLGIKGVYYNIKEDKYRAQIKKNGKVIYLGQFNTPKAASRVYQKAAREYFGEFASF